MKFVLALACATVVWSAVDTTPVMAQNYAWCAIYSGRSMGGSKSCSFNSFEQCQAQVSGIGGFCQPNYYYSGAKQPRRKAKRARTYYR
jgi:hypothetical protein